MSRVARALLVRGVAGLVCLGLVVGASSAEARPKAPRRRRAVPVRPMAPPVAAPLPVKTEPPVTSLDPDTEIAKRHFEAGIEHYRATRYTEALAEFEAVRKVRPHPAIDYNIARCLDRLERIEEAVLAYQRYLAANPHGADAADTRKRVAILEARVAEERGADARAMPPMVPAPAAIPTASPVAPPLPAGPPLPSPVDEGRARTLRLAGIGLGVAAVASIVAGSAVLGSVGQGVAELRARCLGMCPDSEVSALEQRATGGYVLVGVGAAAAVADVAVWIVWAKRHARPPAAVAVPTPTGVAVSGRF